MREVGDKDELTEFPLITSRGFWATSNPEPVKFKVTPPLENDKCTNIHEYYSPATGLRTLYRHN